MLLWTRRETVLLAFIALIPVVVYELFDQKWLHLPWLPIAVVGTAVVGFELLVLDAPRKQAAFTPQSSTIYIEPRVVPE